ncbi:hypothetical protein NliqN6_5231 [Naganishia liquefaciens]|uniref:Major facilitator superfamily (MFS) profile domain-containing protein n=1 Tax=Naganishia liquefaciens TaxID=104408 RepID=A0A8H3TXD1_9TREE|nr:hypothetical protein NliqN6_5231 [Naganishia liquefaciens]
MSEKADIYHSEKADTTHIDYSDEKNLGVTGSEQDLGHFIADAADAAQQQKTQTTRGAFAMWKPAVIWSIIFSSAIIMEGYDTILLGQFWAQPAFAQKYGKFDPKSGTYQVAARWQTGLSCAVQVGNILGLQITGPVAERFGYRLTMLVALIALTGFLFIQFFAANIEMLLAGYLLLGFPWGTFQTMSVSYAADVMPVHLRQYLTTYVNLCWVIGQIIASGVLRGLVGNDTQWAYRIPFAIQWVWPVPIMIGIAFAPESPYWLVKKGRTQDAEKALMRLSTRASGFNEEEARKQVAMMSHTNEIEKASTEGVSFVDCFKGVNLRRTEIACLVWLNQNTSGSALMGQATYFFQQAGLNNSAASTLNLCMFIVGFIGTVGSWFIMKPFGRRTLFFYGQASCTTLMLLVGILGTVTKRGGSGGWAIGALLITFTFLYDLTVGPVCYSLVAEIPSTRLRAKTVILARNLYNLGGLVIGIVNPYMLNPTEWNLGAKAGYVWAVGGLLSTIWIFFRLPEPKGRTYGELDILFEQKTPARKFASTHVDEFDAHERNAAAAVTGGAMVH